MVIDLNHHSCEHCVEFNTEHVCTKVCINVVCFSSKSHILVNGICHVIGEKIKVTTFPCDLKPCMTQTMCFLQI